MAELSKLTLPNGSTYDLKDIAARNDISSNYVKKSGELLTTNPFAPPSMKGPYISKIDDGFYAADKRFNVTATIDDAPISTNVGWLFNGSYEYQTSVPAGKSIIITIDCSNTSTGYFLGYPYGYMLVSFYYANIPASVSGRVYCNYEPHTIGWHNIDFSLVPDSSSINTVYRGYNGKYNISKFEFTITAGSDTITKISEIEMHLDRPDSSRTPFLSKYQAETLYYPLTAPNFLGQINGHTVEKDVSSNAVFTDTFTTAYSATAAATAAKVASMTYFSLRANEYVHINFRYTNTAASALTLNINGTGAKTIYINGSASSSSNYTLPAGSYIAFYDGTNYYLRTDNKLPANITGTVNGHSVDKDVPSNAVFTDTTALTSMTGTLAIGHGGTGGTTAEAARSNLGLGAAATYSVESTVANDSKLTTGSAVTAYVGDKIADKVDSIDIINGSDMPVRKQILCEPTTTFTSSGTTTYSGVFRFAGASYYQTYRNMQGGCYYPTEDCFILAIVDANLSNGILVKVNRSYEVISRGNPIGIGHGNDLTYCSADGKVYLAPCDDGPNAGKIIRINPTNLTLEAAIDVGHSTYQIAYDEVNQRFFMLYSTTLYIHSPDLTLIKSIEIDWNYLGNGGRLVRQVIFAYKGLFYLQSFSEKAANTVYETIYVQAFDETGKVRSTAKYLPYFAGEEPEAICVVGSIAYVFSGHTWLNISRITLDNTAAVELNGDSYYAFGGKRIEQNSDLNDYLVLGKYDCPNFTYANSLSNCPYKLSAFTLNVLNNGHTNIRQEIVGLDGIRYERILRVDGDYVAHYDDWYKVAKYKAPTTTTLTGTIASATSTQIGTCSVERLSCGIITVTASFPQNAVGRRQVNINNTWLDGVNAVADDQTLITSTYFYNNTTINAANVPIRLYQNSGDQLTYTVTVNVLSI